MESVIPYESLRAIFAGLAELEPARVIWQGESAPHAAPDDFGRSGVLVLDVIARRKLGVDEETRQYDVDVEGETFTRVTYTKNRQVTVQVRAEEYDQTQRGHDVLDDITSKLEQDDTTELLSAAGLAVASIQDIVPLEGSNAAGRAIPFAVVDVIFNIRSERVVDHRPEDGDTYIDCVEVTGEPELEIAGTDTIGPPPSS